MLAHRVVFTVTLGELAEVPGSPLAYWAPKRLRELFQKYPPLDRDVARRRDQPKIADVKVGLQTSDDLRFTRYWWEVPVETIATSREETFRGKKWVPFAKGGRPFFRDIQVIVNWGNDGEEIRDFPKAVIRNESYYFRPGLAWAEVVRSKRFEVFLLPGAVIFGHTANAAFLGDENDLWTVLAYVSSTTWSVLFHLLDPLAHHRTVGCVSRIPITLIIINNNFLLTLSQEAHDRLREWATGDETATVFAAPWILQVFRRWQGKTDADLMPVTGHPLARDFSWRYGVPEAVMTALAETMARGFSLKALAEACVRWEESLRRRVDEIQRQIDDEVYRLYGITDEDRALIEAELARPVEAEEESEAPEGVESPDAGTEPDEAEVSGEVLSPEEHIRRLVHFVARAAIREDPDGIVPLHDFYPPGRTEVEHGLAHRVRQKLREIFGGDAMPTVERELQAALGKPLDAWLATDFFEYHVGLYRLRPVVWQIVPPRPEGPHGRGRRSRRADTLPFSVFIDWHKLDADTLRKVRSVYLQPHLDAAERAVREAEQRAFDLRQRGASVQEPQQAEKTLEDARNRRDVLRTLAERMDALVRSHRLEVKSRSAWVKEKIDEIVAQGYRPNRDYGVWVNIEPLKQAGILPRAADRVKG